MGTYRRVLPFLLSKKLLQNKRKRCFLCFLGTAELFGFSADGFLARISLSFQARGPRFGQEVHLVEFYPFCLVKNCFRTKEKGVFWVFWALRNFLASSADGFLVNIPLSFQARRPRFGQEVHLVKFFKL